jgi:ABC-2 type transport system permease protein
MSIRRALTVLAKDIQVGPRSPIVLYAIILPAVLTLLIQVVFGTLFEPKPRLGIVDKGTSQVTAEAKVIEGIQVTLLDDTGKLREKVEANDLDAGLVLQEDFDEAVRSGSRPELEFYIGGESLASNRIILAVTTIDLIRGVEGSEPPVEVQVTTLGEAVLPLSQRLVPLILFYALFFAGVFVPAMSLVDEKEHKTLDAVLVTPARMSEVLLAKAAFGFILAMLMALATLLLNNALGSQPWALLAALAVSALMASEISILYAAAAKDSKALFTLIKSMGIFLFAPVIFYIWPDLPQWIAKIFPTYWMLQPIYEVGIAGGGFPEIRFELIVALAICVAMLPIIGMLSRRMELKLASE